MEQRRPKSEMSRRGFVAAGAGGVLLGGLAISSEAREPQSNAPDFPSPPENGATVGWLERPGPKWMAGTTFGVAWPEGQHQPDQNFALNSGEKSIAIDSRPIGFWPDGSLKWSAHSIGGNDLPAGETFTVEPAMQIDFGHTVKTTASNGSVTIDTGSITASFGTGGPGLLDSLTRDGRDIALNGRLIAHVQNDPNAIEGDFSVRALDAEVSAVSIENATFNRACVKVAGVLKASPAGDEPAAELPFVVRFYFYAGSDAVRIVHSIVFDADPDTTFIRGLGVRFDVPMSDETDDRHVRFTGQDRGVFGEAVKGITGLRRDPGEAVRKAQIAGDKLPPLSEWAESVSGRLQWVPEWGDYSLSQLSADGFQIRKRTKPGHGWIQSTAGQRAGGAGYVGGVSGGLAFGIRDFWQSHPTQLDIRSAQTETAKVTMWLWSPEAPAMDLRYYHDGMGQDTYEKQLDALNITYEDYEPGFGTAKGIARTSEMLLRVCDTTPTRDDMADFGEAVATPPQLVCPPEQLVKAGVFGKLFSLPDRSTPARAKLEEHLDYIFNFYRDQQENQRWYGFWDYGDIMHTYDPDRHTWRYDVGGYAWDNSELSPDLWLWYATLRSGRGDLFRFAEAMTRHTGEVDVYHAGKFKYLGTRHNVQHWGCSAKQMRISTAIYRRFYYFLTADERVGDLLDEQTNVVDAAINLDPIRKVRPDEFDPKPEALSISTGTDFSGVAAAWLTAWERTGDDQWRDKLLAMTESVGELPKGFFSPTSFNLHTSRFSALRDTVEASHLSAVFGLVEINAELIQLLEVPKFKEAWLQYCRLYNAPAEQQKAELGVALPRLILRDHHSRLTAYAAEQTGDPDLARRAWHEFFNEETETGMPEMSTTRIDGPAVMKAIDEDPRISTNWAAQYGLSIIENLALAGDSLPEK